MAETGNYIYNKRGQQLDRIPNYVINYGENLLANQPNQQNQPKRKESEECKLI